MPARRVPRPLKGTVPGRVGKPDMRNYSTRIPWRDTPSDRFDWEPALIRFAHTMRDLGYTLSIKQQKRIDDHATT